GHAPEHPIGPVSHSAPLACVRPGMKRIACHPVAGARSRVLGWAVMSASSSAMQSDLENPTEEHRMLRQMVRELAREVVEPQADEHDRTASLNVPLMQRLGELGLLGVTVPSEYGGAGMDALA